MNPNIAENIAQTTSNVGHGLLDKVDKATESGRELVDQGSRATQDIVGKGIEKINQAQEKLTQVQDETVKQYDKVAKGVNRRIVEKPVQTALVFAGVSAVLTFLLTRNKKPKYQRD